MLFGAACLVGCSAPVDAPITITFPGSAVADEGRLLEAQLTRFMRENPGIRVERLRTPDSADERHQLYVQWLNAGVARPDVLQLDVVWTAEFAEASWILPLDEFAPEVDDLFLNVLEAGRVRGRLFALPWFTDVGMLFYRKDFVDAPPETLEELVRMAARAREEGFEHGFVWQGARYEGLVTVFLEHLGAFGGQWFGDRGELSLSSPEAELALSFMRDSIHELAIVPEVSLTWQEEQTRFAFQNGQAAFMRNWPYAWRLLQDPERSRVAGRIAVAPMPAGPGGSKTATLGGSLLAVNAHSEHPEAAYALIEFLSRPEQMLERARVTGQLPPRASLYDEAALARANTVLPAGAHEVIRHARPRPTSPVYTELSRRLQVHLHRALAGQESPALALSLAEAAMQEVLDRTAPADEPPRRAPVFLWLFPIGLAVGLGFAFRRALRRARDAGSDLRETRVAWGFVSPAVVAVALVGVFPLFSTVWESLHGRDLRMPWRGSPYVGLSNYRELFGDERFFEALVHTGIFTVTSVSLEMVLGIAAALALDRTFRGRGPIRAMVLLPWAIPTVVAALIFRFLFEAEAGVANAVIVGVGLVDEPIVWLGRSVTAWVPIVLADVWKTTPFVALLLLAGLQTIDDELLEAARIDGAKFFRRLFHVILPLLAPALLVVLLFRTLDAVRIFDLVYVLTAGGPGTSTEPMALYAFEVLLHGLRFGYGSAIAVVIFLLTLGLALIYVRALGGREAR